VEIIGGTDPGPLNLSSGDFYDGVHLKPESLNGFFKSKVE
jgi:hypothetical protein